MTLGGWLVQDWEVRRAHVAASGRPPAAPVWACQGISHFIGFFVARLSFVLRLKDGASKAMASASTLHLDTAYSGDLLIEKSVAWDRLLFFFFKLQIPCCVSLIDFSLNSSPDVNIERFIAIHFFTAM